MGPHQTSLEQRKTLALRRDQNSPRRKFRLLHATWKSAHINAGREVNHGYNSEFLSASRNLYVSRDLIAVCGVLSCVTPKKLLGGVFGSKTCRHTSACKNLPSSGNQVD